MEKNITGDSYVTARDECTALTSAGKTDYFRNQLEKPSNKNMFRLLRSLDGQRVQQQPEFRLAAEECKLFSRFFRGKIDNLLSGLQFFNDIDRSSDEIRCFTDCIDVFDRTTNTEITAICSANKKTCMLDPLPANQLTDRHHPYCACHHTDHKCFPGRGSDAEVVEACNCPTTFEETITGQKHLEQLPTSE